MPFTRYSSCPPNPPTATATAVSLKGCRPGPGRPRKRRKLHYLPEDELECEVVEFDAQVKTWRKIVKNLGPESARALLADLENLRGTLRYRNAALSAIAQRDTAVRRPAAER